MSGLYHLIDNYELNSIVIIELCCNFRTIINSVPFAQKRKVDGGESLLIISFELRLLVFNSSLLDLHADGPSHGRGNGVADLSMLVQDGAEELVGVREALRASAFAHTDDPVLLWV